MTSLPQYKFFSKKLVLETEGELSEVKKITFGDKEVSLYQYNDRNRYEHKNIENEFYVIINNYYVRILTSIVGESCRFNKILHHCSSCNIWFFVDFADCQFCKKTLSAVKIKRKWETKSKKIKIIPRKSDITGNPAELRCGSRCGSRGDESDDIDGIVFYSEFEEGDAFWKKASSAGMSSSEMSSSGIPSSEISSSAGMSSSEKNKKDTIIIDSPYVKLVEEMNQMKRDFSDEMTQVKKAFFEEMSQMKKISNDNCKLFLSNLEENQINETKINDRLKIMQKELADASFHNSYLEKKHNELRKKYNDIETLYITNELKYNEISKISSEISTEIRKISTFSIENRKNSSENRRICSEISTETRRICSELSQRYNMMNNGLIKFIDAYNNHLKDTDNLKLVLNTEINTRVEQNNKIFQLYSMNREFGQNELDEEPLHKKRAIDLRGDPQDFSE